MTIFLILIPVLTWGLKDVFLKMASTERDFHLKIFVYYAIFFFPFLVLASIFGKSDSGLFSLVSKNSLLTIAYLFYCVVLVISFYGVKFLEISVFSPLEDLGGLVSYGMLLTYYFLTNNHYMISEILNVGTVLGLLLAFVGVFLLARFQNKIASVYSPQNKDPSKMKHGAWIFAFPLLYCCFDGFLSFFDRLSLKESSLNDLSSIDLFRIYSFICVVGGIVSWIILLIKNKRPYIPFHKKSTVLFIVSLYELIAGIIYPFAMKTNSIIPIIAFSSSSAVTIIASKIFLSERLTRKQYFAVSMVILGMLLVALGEEI